MSDLTPEAWIEILFYDFWMSAHQITPAEYERQLRLVAIEMELG